MQVRQPSIRSGRSWMWRIPRRRVRSRCSSSVNAVLASGPRRNSDQTPSTGFTSGAHEGELDDSEPVVLVRVLTHPGGPVRVQIVPDQDDGSLELDVGADDQVAVVAPREGVASFAAVLAVAARPVDQPGGLARLVTAHRRDKTSHAPSTPAGPAAGAAHPPARRRAGRAGARKRRRSRPGRRRLPVPAWRGLPLRGGQAVRGPPISLGAPLREAHRGQGDHLRQRVPVRTGPRVLLGPSNFKPVPPPNRADAAYTASPAVRPPWNPVRPWRRGPRGPGRTPIDWAVSGSEQPRARLRR